MTIRIPFWAMKFTGLMLLLRSITTRTETGWQIEFSVRGKRITIIAEDDDGED